MDTTRGLIGCALLALACCAPGVAQVSARPPEGAPRVPAFRPLVDHHQHLASAADTRLLNRSLEAVALPVPLAQVLLQLETSWNVPSALAALYGEDAIALSNAGEPNIGWRQGREPVAQYMGTLFARPFDMVPVKVASTSDEARVAGYLSRGAGPAARHFGYFIIELRRTGDRWLIVSDSRVFSPAPAYQAVVDAPRLLAGLDEAGIGRAVILSEAYWFDSGELRWPGATPAEILRDVQAENDWTAAQAEASNGRLVAFCSLNPLADYALAELERCVASRRFAGLKLHLQTSDVDLQREEHVRAVRGVFEAADRLSFPIIVHSQTRGPYNTATARIFVERVLEAAPHISVTIAHLWGGGPFNREALDVYVDYATSGRPGAARLTFDVAEAALVANGDAAIDRTIADAIRRIGVKRILYGSDAIGPNTLSPVQATGQFRRDIPLDAAEFDAIAGNIAPYLR